MLALALPLLTGQRLSARYAAVAAIAAGLFAATVTQMRPEPVMLLGGMALALLFAGSLTWRVRALTLALLFIAAVLGLRAWDRYFDHKFLEASRVVALAGGHVLSAPTHYHVFWH